MGHSGRHAVRVRDARSAARDHQRRLDELRAVARWWPLGLAASVGLYFSPAASVRSRRAERLTLRAIGFTKRQLRRSVLVQAVATTAAGLLIGAPLGVILGRYAWRGFASQLGVGTNPTVPATWTVATVLGGLSSPLLSPSSPRESRLARRFLPSPGPESRGANSSVDV
ncbi:MAG: FtsX-like permease family protein [Acidimicrobiales bacterium]